MNVIKEILKEFSEFEEFTVWSEYGSAAVCLATVYNAVTHYDLKVNIEEILNEFESHFRSISEKDIIEYLESIRDRALKILSIGERFNDDEILLILDFQINAELIEGMLKSNHIELNNNYHESIYELANECFSKQQNLSDYNFVKSLLEKNLRLPMKLSWIEVNKGFSSRRY